MGREGVWVCSHVILKEAAVFCICVIFDNSMVDDGEEIHMMVIITRMVIKRLLFSVSVSTVLSAIMALMSFQ